MEYLLLICSDEEFNATPELRAETQAWVSEMDGRGVRRRGNRLRPPRDATTVRVRNGDLLLTDGPFAETKELMGGFDLIECADLDEAVGVAAAHPMAKLGMIEIRPLWPL